jgi:ATP-dependent Clp protease ATP-binding subunit ClpB
LLSTKRRQRVTQSIICRRSDNQFYPVLFLAKSGIQLQFSDYLVDFLAENGFDPQFGARPLKRLIQKEIVNNLSKRILAGDVDKSHPVLVDVFDGVVVFRNEVEQHVG